MCAVKYPVKHFRFHLDCHMIIITTGSEKLCVESMVAGQYYNASRKYYIKIDKELKTVATEERGQDTYIYVISRKRTQANRWILFEWLSRFLFSIVSPKTFSLHCGTDDINFDNLFVWSITNRFSSVCVQGGWQIPISPENLEFLLNNIFAEELSLGVWSTTEDYKFGGLSNIVPKIKKIDIRSQNWVDFDNFIQTIRFPIVKYRVFSYEEINQILKQWINDGDNTLERLSLDAGSRWMKRSQVLRGIDATPTVLTKEQMDRCCGIYYRDDVEFLDIKRNSDGRLATIGLYDRSVTLNVWTQNPLEQEGNQ